MSKRNAGPRRPQLQPIDRRGWREAVRAAESIREPLPAEPPPERLAG